VAGPSGLRGSIREAPAEATKVLRGPTVLRRQAIAAAAVLTCDDLREKFGHNSRPESRVKGAGVPGWRGEADAGARAGRGAVKRRAHGGAERGNAAEQSGGSARVPRVLRSLGLGFQGTGETPFVGRRGPIGVRARGKKVAGDLAGRCAPGKKEERGKKGADRWDRTARERKGERAGSGWAAEGKREKREARGWGELGRGAAHAEGRGERGRESWAGPRRRFGLP
jgi:hypothetical protein